VGCDGCFAQIPEIEERLSDMGINLVSVMVQPASQVDPVARQFGIQSPILIDEDLSVSNAYDMVGVYGHSDRPSHSFALVSKDRTIKWVKHYATMFVPIDDFLSDLATA
jgi:peroxiredoxin